MAAGGHGRWRRDCRFTPANGVAIFLTTHRLDEAERLCDRVAIANTTLRMIGRPAGLRDRLFTKTFSSGLRRS